MLSSVGASFLALAASVSALDLSVASSGGNASAPMAYGVMFEDINHSGDGGIYAELIQNRAFQGSAVFPSTLDYWSAIGGAQLSLQNLSQPLSSSLPTSVNVATSGASGQVGFANAGFWGFDVKVQDYKGSFWVYGNYTCSFTASLVSAEGSNTTFANTTIEASSGTASSNGWTQYNYTLTPTVAAPNSNNSFVLTFDAAYVAGSLNFDLISLFPPTYNNRENGNRIDLMQNLKGLNPSFLRQPGGNNLEGNDPPYLWYWNQTIGPLTDRPGRPGTWGYENTDGLGLIEYFHWCQDLGMEPILAVWAGEFLDGTIYDNATVEYYVQYALDELEFLMGDASTTYGAQRIALGYPEPFQVNYVEIGNEDNLNDGLSSYTDYRFPDFDTAINAKYPNITVIASTISLVLPNDASGDYHQYTRPDQLVGQFNMFDQNTSDHKTMVGELAIIQPNSPTEVAANFSEPRLTWPQWIGSVAEAVFLIGTERNSDAIIGAAYAPTLENLNSIQWLPDLIAFTADPAQTVLSTSYHVIAFLSGTRIAETLPVSGAVYGPAYYVAGTSASGGRILKTAVYNSTGDYPLSVSFDGVAAGTQATLTVLTAPSGFSENIDPTNIVASNTTTVTATGNGTFVFELPNLSVSILEVGAANATEGSGGYGRRGAVVAREYVS